MLILLLYVCFRTCVSFVVLVFVAVQLALLQRVGPTSATVHWLFIKLKAEAPAARCSCKL